MATVSPIRARGGGGRGCTDGRSRRRWVSSEGRVGAMRGEGKRSEERWEVSLRSGRGVVENEDYR